MILSMYLMNVSLIFVANIDFVYLPLVTLHEHVSVYMFSDYLYHL